MPIALNPNERFSHVLENDRTLPEPKQARFWFHYLTMAEIAEASGPLIKAEETGKLAASNTLTLLCQSIACGLVGWDHVTGRDGKPIEFAAKDAPEALMAMLTVSEGWELHLAALRGSRLSVPDKNASGSPSPGDSGPSAGADPAPAAGDAAAPPA